MQFALPPLRAQRATVDPPVAGASALPKTGSIMPEAEGFFDIWSSAVPSDSGAATPLPHDSADVQSLPVPPLLSLPPLPEATLDLTAPSPWPDVSGNRKDTGPPEDARSADLAPRVVGAAVAIPPDTSAYGAVVLALSPSPDTSATRNDTNPTEGGLPGVPAPRVIGVAVAMHADPIVHCAAPPAATPEPAETGEQDRSGTVTEPDFPVLQDSFPDLAQQELVATGPRPGLPVSVSSQAVVGPDRPYPLQAGPPAQLAPLPIPGDNPAPASVLGAATVAPAAAMPEFHRNDPAGTVDAANTVSMAASQGSGAAHAQAVREEADLIPDIRRIIDTPQSAASTSLAASPPLAIPLPHATHAWPAVRTEPLPSILPAVLPQQPVPQLPIGQFGVGMPDASPHPDAGPFGPALAEPELWPQLRMATPPVSAPPLPSPVETASPDRPSTPGAQIELQQQMIAEPDFAQSFVQQGPKPVSATNPGILPLQTLPNPPHLQGIEPLLATKNVSNIAENTRTPSAIPLEPVPSRPSPDKIDASLPIPTPPYLGAKLDQFTTAAVPIPEPTISAMATMPSEGSGLLQMPPDAGPDPGRAPLQIVHSAVLAEGQRLLAAPPEGPVTLTLSPEELGTLRFVVRETENGIHLHLTVDQPATLDLLRRQGDLLISDLRQAGFHNASLSFAGQEGQSNGHRRDDAPNPAPVAPSYRGDDLPERSNPALPSTPTGKSLNLRL